MTSIRWPILAAALAAGLPATAHAGPIHWSYYCSGASDGAYWFNAGGYPLTTPAGQTETIFLLGGWGYPIYFRPIPPQGPVLWTAVTIADAESGLSETFDVAVEFYDFEPPDPSEWWYKHEPRIMPFNTFEIDFGEHQYVVSNGPNPRALSVLVTGTPPVSETPEPTAVIMAGVGLAAVGLVRRRRLQSPTCDP